MNAPAGDRMVVFHAFVGIFGFVRGSQITPPDDHEGLATSSLLGLHKV